MSKKINFKVCTSLALLLLIFILFGSTKVYADDTRDVSVTVQQNIICPDYAISNIMQSISKSTYSYNDGNYKGTLNFAYFGPVTKTVNQTYPDLIIYQHSFTVTYTGTVTKIVLPDTKDVTVTVPFKITAPDSAFSNIMKSISTSTHSYDDGTYKGTLNLTNIGPVTKTVSATYPDLTLYQYTFDVTYTGTVTRY